MHSTLCYCLQRDFNARWSLILQSCDNANLVMTLGAQVLTLSENGRRCSVYTSASVPLRKCRDANAHRISFRQTPRHFEKKDLKAAIVDSCMAISDTNLPFTAIAMELGAQLAWRGGIRTDSPAR